MKTTYWKYLPLLLICLILPLSLQAGWGAGIRGSNHDFSGSSWNTAGENPGEICRVCHAPHDRGLDMWLGSEAGLLWNHEMSTASYTMYTSESLAGSIEGQPTGRSKLCLSCHDGTVAIDAFDGRPGGGEDMMMDYAFGGRLVVPSPRAAKDGDNLDLRSHHPISVQYIDNVKIGKAGGLHDPDDATYYDSNKVARFLEFGRVECHSCHDVHDVSAVPQTQLLRAGTNIAISAPSALCLTCHNK